MSTPWPFHIWAFELIGPINIPSQGHIWILLTTECYTKWVKKINLKQAIAVANFIWDKLFANLAFLSTYIKNGTLFVNVHVWEMLDSYGIDHVKSSPYHCKWNGQAKASNKTSFHILSKMVYDEPKKQANSLTSPNSIPYFETNFNIDQIFLSYLWG